MSNCDHEWSFSRGVGHTCGKCYEIRQNNPKPYGIKRASEDYSNWSMDEMVSEIKRLAKKIEDEKNRHAQIALNWSCGFSPGREIAEAILMKPQKVESSDVSTCCSMPVTQDKDSASNVCEKCGDECGVLNPEGGER